LARLLFYRGKTVLRWNAAALTALCLLAACTTNPIPPGYMGPIARIQDSETSRGKVGGDFFFLSQIDGHDISDSLTATRTANYGQGFSMNPVSLGRDIPAQPAHFTIIGRTHFAAPIIELVRTVYQISGETDFTPLADHVYVVKGVLGEDYSAVWIEDAATGAVAGQKIEKHGSSALGVLEK
jgi:hypothetical protein